MAVDIRVGTVTACEPNVKARVPAYILTIDFGPELGVKRSSAQLTKRYAEESLVGRQVLAVVNFPVKKIAGVNSECLVLGLPGQGEGEVVLIGPERSVENGMRLY